MLDGPTPRFSRRTIWIVCAILVCVLAFGAGGLIAVLRNSGTTEAARPITSTVASTVVPVVPTTTKTASTTTPVPTTTVPAVPSFDQMSQFVRALYGALPRDTDYGWSVFDANYSNQFSRASYEQFWSTIRSVTVVSVTPRDATSVTLRLRYVTQNGNIDTENRSMSVISKQGQLFVYDSTRLGPA